MGANIALILVLLAIFVSIAIGFNLKINTGLVAMFFAYIIGCFLMGFSVSSVVNMWPVKVAFMLMTVTLFYGYAVENGTLNVIANQMLYRVKGVAWAIPFMIWAVSCLLSAMGSGAMAVSAFMSPLGIAIALQTGMNPLLAMFAIATGSLAGSDFTFSQNGVIVRGLLEDTQYAEQALNMTNRIFLNGFAANLLLFCIAYVAFKGFATKKLDMDKPAPPNNIQKKNLLLICIIMVLIVVPVVINLFAKNPVTVFMAKYCDIQLLAAVGAMLCALLRLGNEKQIIKNQVPWNTIIMVGGISMLMAVAKEIGAIEYLSAWVGSSVPKFLIPVILSIVAGGMSFFSGAITVVVPMLVPILPALADSTGLNPIMLVSVVLVSSCCTGFSPFSTGGSLLLSGIHDEALSTKIFYRQFLMTFVVWACVIILVAIGFFNLFS